MKLLKNEEVRRSFVMSAVFASFAVLIAFIWDVYFGIFTLVLCILFLVIFMNVTKRRYKKITKLSNDLNKILHGDYNINLQQYSEGELSILQSEIYKMTVKLWEQKKLLEEDKAFLSDSLADISHQLRTPLTSANLLVSLISDPNLSDSKRMELANQLLRTLSRMDLLIVTLLKISKFDAGTIELKKEKISLEKLIHKAAEHIMISMEIKEQDFVHDVRGSFTGDILWTVEAISNILKNCMEHTPQGGKIEVFASENAIYSEIIIRDTGYGFSKKDLNHIFDRFYKGQDSSEQSFGIGLSLSKTIIVNQNGTIKARNSNAGGAEFIIKFYK